MKSISKILWFFCVVFALTGLCFLTIPKQIIALANYGGEFANFPPLPGDGRFWNVFAFAYMVLVTVLAYSGASHPENSRPMLAILVAGKLSTSITALALFFLDLRAMGYLATFAIDAPIALVFLWCFYRVGNLQSAKGVSDA